MKTSRYPFDEEDTEKLQKAAKQVVNALAHGADYLEEIILDLKGLRDLPTTPQTIMALVRLLGAGAQLLQALQGMGLYDHIANLRWAQQRPERRRHRAEPASTPTQ